MLAGSLRLNLWEDVCKSPLILATPARVKQSLRGANHCRGESCRLDPDRRNRGLDTCPGLGDVSFDGEEGEKPDVQKMGGLEC
jgi:hypothetical protein